SELFKAAFSAGRRRRRAANAGGSSGGAACGPTLSGQTGPAVTIPPEPTPGGRPTNSTGADGRLKDPRGLGSVGPSPPARGGRAASPARRRVAPPPCAGGFGTSSIRATKARASTSDAVRVPLLSRPVGERLFGALDA